MLQRQLASVDHLVRWVVPEQLHLTLKFFGNIAAAEVPMLVDALGQSARTVRPFKLSLENIGGFPSVRRPNVIWIGLGGELEWLTALQRSLDERTAGVGSHAETRAFKPHLTIGRARRRDSDVRPVGSAIQQVQFATPLEWTVSALHLVQSKLSPKGSTYSDLKTVQLG